METGRPSIGQAVGNYRISALLGSGGMGAVYRATDLRLEREVALKVLRPETLGLDPQAVERFRREARALAKLNHPHIATVHDVGEQDGLDYIVMELVGGEPLSARLRGGPLGVREATQIALEIAEALEEAHGQGVVHRDVKPANVMLTQRGHVKVLDFGLAKLLAPTDETQTSPQTQWAVGTPLYMSPEQATGRPVDARTDLWSLGVLYYEALTGQTPFRRESGMAILRAIADDTPRPLRDLQPALPVDVEQIVARALEKDPAARYQTAAEMAEDLRGALDRMSGAATATVPVGRPPVRWRRITAISAVTLAAVGLAGWGLMRRTAERRWAREDAIPEIERLEDARKPLAAWLVLERAEKDLPGDARLRDVAAAQTQTLDVTSDPPGADVEVQDYLTPDGPWVRLGTTPLRQAKTAKGYFRWRISKSGVATMVTAPPTRDAMHFALTAAQQAPAGMVYSPGGKWSEYIAFLGWVGPYTLSPYYVDRDEVTNRAYQAFVDAGGYTRAEYWPAQFSDNGKTEEWSEAMAQFRDTTGRPGPSTWAGGHYPEGQADYPVSGVSWYEASAYARYAGKSLPVLAQWYQTAPPDLAEYTVQLSNISGKAPAAVGSYAGLGPYGTYDTAGNVREWVANPVDGELRFILGGWWRSPAYLSSDPEALTPFDRSQGNGFRCVRNVTPLPDEATQSFHSVSRDFSRFRPVNDDVFHAYELLYAYDQTPLHAEPGGIVQQTEDWVEEKVTIDAAYNGERMAVYLFLPKRVKPPYQTVLFFPSARVLFLEGDSSRLGDINFFDYILQSGRAVVYPVYEDTYERRVRYSMPGGAQNVGLTVDWYKDAARALDYVATRQDLDSSRLAYLGVSMGAADGVILSTLLQDRLRAAIFLDGGYFLGTPPPGADQADFAPRMKKPVLMVNGQYDYTFPVVTAQDPLFAMLGTPGADKRHVILDTPHDVTERRPQLVQEVLSWLDRFLGRVGS